MTWHMLASLKDLQAQNRIVTEVAGEKILLIWYQDQVHAVQASCPHLKLPLTKAKINDDNQLVCPFHKSAFDLCTGDVRCWAPWPPILSGVLGALSKPKNLQIYPVRLEADEIFVDV